jgi:hypothetical protein
VKIEQALGHYLLKNKSLSLQGIGTFHLNVTVPDTADTERPIILPENAVSFHYDPRTSEDESLVDFIVEHTHKIKPLASSDLESFLSLGRQFLNIGKPFVLQNIGTLDKTNSGELVFKPGQLVAEKIEPHKIKNDEPEADPGEENYFNEYQQQRKSSNGPKLLLVFLILLVLGFISWSVWHYLANKKDTSENVTSTEPIVPITEDTSRFQKDSTIIANAIADSINAIQQKASDTVSFKVVVRQYKTPGAAEKRLKELQNYHRNVIMYTDDSVTYKLAEPFNLPLSDTTKILDSLKRYYTKVYLEK